MPSLSLPLSLCVSQTAVLLTAAKNTLPSTGQLSPGMFVELSESQPSLPPPVRRRVRFKLTQKWPSLVPRESNASLRVQSTSLRRRQQGCSRVTGACFSSEGAAARGPGPAFLPLRLASALRVLLVSPMLLVS